MPIFNTPLMYYVFHITGWHLLYLNLALGGGYILAFMQGWGEYFDIGTWVQYYKGHREVLWVDWILFKLFGPEWIPNNPAVTPDNPDFDLIPSPTGDVNPYEWRRNRDTVGMGLRHLMSICIFGSLGLIGHYFMGVAWLQAGLVIGLTIPFAVGTALLYRYFMRTGVTWPTNPVYRIDQPTGRAEGATGTLLHLLIAIAFIIMFA